MEVEPMAKANGAAMLDIEEGLNELTELVGNCNKKIMRKPYCNPTAQAGDNIDIELILEPPNKSNGIEGRCYTRISCGGRVRRPHGVQSSVDLAYCTSDSCKRNMMII
uniref:Uncharacterized protein n=1 Tax=Romanomermis culicivorax TaxID=13658 RepID=A0A915HW81_ROMCU